ncbi:helix-turn-helix domain-containing protein [Segnochrobactraceae bacterium EtOH-i3]
MSAEIPADPESPNPVAAQARDHARGVRIARHVHDRAQIIALLSGALRLELDDRVLSVPPGRAAFLPGGVAHAAVYTDHSAVRMAYLDPAAYPELPADSLVFPLTGLLRELLVRSIELGTATAWTAREARLHQVLADEIARAPEAAPSLALGRDPRLRRVTEALLADPADRRPLPDWAAAAGTTERTLARLFVRETGLSFARWRQKLQLVRAVEMLAAGNPVTRVALDLGYATPSAFSAMFSREMGVSPAGYGAAPGVG